MKRKYLLKLLMMSLTLLLAVSPINASCVDGYESSCLQQCKDGCQDDPNGYSQCYTGCKGSCTCGSSGGGSSSGETTTTYKYYINVVQVTGGTISTTYSATVKSSSKTKTIYESNFSYTVLDGYEFIDFEYSTDNSTWTTFEDSYKMSKSTTLYVRPVFNPITYNLSYTLNGGTMSGQKTTYTVETDAFTLPNPTRTGYTLKGWTGSNGTTPQLSVTIEKGSIGDKSYTANWTANTVKFLVNQYIQGLDGNYFLNESAMQSDKTDSKVKINSFANALDGFTFIKGTN